MADLVLVNSAFTRGVFAATFTTLHARGIVPEVLHPAVCIPPSAELAHAAGAWTSVLDPKLVSFAQVTQQVDWHA